MNPPKPEPVEIRTYQDAVRAIVDRPYCRSTQYKDAVRFTDLTCASEQLADFIGRLLRRAKKMGIPLYCESASFDVAFIVHARKRRELDRRSWEVIGHLGAEISQQYNLGVHWMGPMMGSCWLSGPPAQAIAAGGPFPEGVL